MEKKSRTVIALALIILSHYLVVWLGIRATVANTRSYLNITGTVLDPLTQWDSQWYAAIGTYGYKIPLFAQKAFLATGNHIPFTPSLRATAYFPLVPLIVHLFGVIGTLIITNMIFISTIVIMYSLFQKVMSDSLAIWGVLFYAVNPALIFYSSLYTESYLVFFSLLVILCLSKDTKAGTYIACIAGCLCALTHETGFLVGIFGLRYIRTRKYQPAFWFIASVLAGWVLYFGYLWIRFGQPLVTFQAEKAWGRTWRFPGIPFLLELFHHSYLLMDIELFCVMVLGLFAILYIYSTIKNDFTFSPRRDLSINSLETGLFALANFILCMSTYLPGHPLMSVVRLLSVIWPIYSIVWAKDRKSQTWWRIPYLLSFVFIGYFGTVLFTHGYLYQ